MTKKDSDSEIVFGDITHKDLREALNLSDDYEIGSMAEIYDLLIEKKRVNPWLLRMKHGKSASPSSLASGVLPGIIEKYKRRKEEIIPLMEEVGISPKDFAILSDEQKQSARDHNDLRELTLVKVLKEHNLVPESYASMHHHDLVTVMSGRGGVKKFLSEHNMKLPSSHKHLADSVAETLLNPKPKEKQKLRRLASHHNKFNRRKPRAHSQSDSASIRSPKGRSL